MTLEKRLVVSKGRYFGSSRDAYEMRTVPVNGSNFRGEYEFNCPNVNVERSSRPNSGAEYLRRVIYTRAIGGRRVVRSRFRTRYRYTVTRVTITGRHIGRIKYLRAPPSTRPPPARWYENNRRRTCSSPRGQMEKRR